MIYSLFAVIIRHTESLFHVLRTSLHDKNNKET
jgi:hypothetical protein